MTPDKTRLRRARLIERVRSAEQRKAATEAYRAEAVRLKLEQLSERTRSLAQLYTLRDTAADAAELRGAAILGAHLRDLGHTAERQATEARREADGKLADLAAAERRLQRAGESRRELHREMIDRLSRVESTPARKTGTHLE
jgi:replicative DNA helicase